MIREGPDTSLWFLDATCSLPPQLLLCGVPALLGFNWVSIYPGLHCYPPLLGLKLPRCAQALPNSPSNDVTGVWLSTKNQAGRQHLPPPLSPMKPILQTVANIDSCF